MVSILMATFNGEAYVAEQIESLLAQTIVADAIYICDDGSTDGTFSILEQYARQYPARIFLTKTNENMGAAINFMHMMIEHKDAYIMLCDQDDIWLKDKTERTLARMREMEREYGETAPLLVHTDLCVVNEQNEEIAASFWRAMNADCKKTALHQLLIQNCLTGCTAMYNRALAELIDEIPAGMVMHDWWLVLVAGAFGHIGHVQAATIRYRQHRHNVIGAKDVRTLAYKLNRLLHADEVRRAIHGTYPQAADLLAIYGGRLLPEQRQLLQSYTEIPGLSKWAKWKRVRELRAYKNGFARNVAYFLFI